MKKIGFLTKLTIFLVLLNLVSCNESILDLSNPQTFTSENFFKTPGEISQSTNAIYVSFFHHSIGGYQWQEIWDVLGNESEPTASAYGSALEVGIIQMMLYQHSNNNATLNGLWKVWYKMILRANLTIAKSDEYIAANGENDLVTRSKGEAYFLRGFAYFNLANCWGKVPVRTSFDQSANVDAPLAKSVDDVWAVAISDFKMAETLLKYASDYPESEKGRATKGAAIAFLGKTYLYTKKYDLAETEFAKLDGKYSLLPASQFLWNFGQTNENNAESVFEFQSAVNGTSNIWSMFGDPEGQSSPGMNNAIPVLYAWNGSQGWGNWKFPPMHDTKFVYQDEAGANFIDPRGAATFYGGIAGAQTWCSQCGESPNRPFDTATTGFWYKKKTNRETLGTDNWGPEAGNNIRIMRYADVLLMRAECNIMLNNVPKAISFINTVRSRFGIFNYTASKYNATSALELLKKERFLEFTGEGSRFDDLRRWGILEKTLNPELKVLYNVEPVMAKHYHFPIPQGEIDSNQSIDNGEVY